MSVFKNAFAWRQDCKLKSYAKPNSNKIIGRSDEGLTLERQLPNLVTVANRPFYSCVLSYLAMNASKAGVDFALIRTSLLFSCKCQLVSITTT